MQTPNMTKEQRSELRELKSKLRILTRANAKLAADGQKELARIHREATKATALLKRHIRKVSNDATRLKTRAQRNVTREGKGIAKQVSAITRRMDILTGRLS
jgi:hypothetical protein